MGSKRRMGLGSIAIVGTMGTAFLLAGGGWAYETYHDPNQDDAGYCSSCHPGFLSGRSDTTHSLHTGNPDPITGTCSLCHTGSGRDNPLIMWSDDTTRPYGCAGCHGRDYGETIAQDYDNDGAGGNDPFPTSGLAKMSGYGLRKQHLNKGVTLCLTCHADVSQASILGENVNPPNYGTTDVNVTNSCNDEDTGNDADAIGLDNDGDTCIDSGSDSDCGTVNPTPGEAGVTTMLVVTGHTPGSNQMDLSYGQACSANDNNIEYGLLSQVSTYTYSGQECNIGNGGTYTWTYPANDSLFFLVVGNDGTWEGSYGTDSSSAERPEDKTSVTCPVPRNLCGACTTN